MGKKPIECFDCGKRFGSKNALMQHKRDKHRKLADIEGCGKEGAKDVLMDIGDDLPDGAFFALADEFGLEPEDLLE